MVVLDSSALLALLFREPGADVVEPWLERQPVISSVNYSEVIGRFVRDGQPPEYAIFSISPKIRVIPYSRADAVTAASYLAWSRQFGLSLGDRACLALAQRLGTPVLTGDRAWRALPLQVPVVIVR